MASNLMPNNAYNNSNKNFLYELAEQEEKLDEEENKKDTSRKSLLKDNSISNYIKLYNSWRTYDLDLLFTKEEFKQALNKTRMYLCSIIHNIYRRSNTSSSFIIINKLIETKGPLNWELISQMDSMDTLYNHYEYEIIEYMFKDKIGGSCNVKKASELTECASVQVYKYTYYAYDVIHQIDDWWHITKEEFKEFYQFALEFNKQGGELLENN